VAELLLLVELLFQPLSYRDLRYEWVVGQTDWYTCGPAAVATLLTFFGIPTTEKEALELAEEFMRAQGFEPGAERGINALVLKQTLEAKGIPTKGFRVKPEALKDFFDRGGLPIIAHLTEPQKHFVVVIGFVDEKIVLADPSWGRRIIPFTSFVNEHAFSGVILVPLPPPELVSQAKENQKEFLSWGQQEISRLLRLRETLP